MKKRITAFIMALIVLLGTITIPMRAKAVDYKDVAITSITLDGDYAYPKVNGYWGIWQIYLNTDVVLPGTAWQENYQVCLTDETNEIMVKAQKANDKWLYLEIPTEFLPEHVEKTIIVKAGQYASSSGEYGLNITQDFGFHIGGGVWSPVDSTSTITAENKVFASIGTSWDANTVGDANGIYFHTTADNGASFADNWTIRMNPAYVDTNKTVYYGSGIWYADSTDGTEQSRSSSYKPVKIVKFTANDYYVAFADSSIAATTNDLVKVQGYFTDPTTGKIYGFYPMTFRFDGTKWIEETPEVVEKYSGKLAMNEADWALNANTASCIYLKGTDSYLKWNAKEEWTTAQANLTPAGGSIKVDDTNLTDIEFKKTFGSNGFYFLNLKQTVNTGAILTIEGTFKYEKVTVTFDKVQFKWNGSAWVVVEEETPSYEMTMTIEGSGWFGTNANGNSNALYVHGTDTYLTAEGEVWNAPNRILIADDDNSGVFVGDEKLQGVSIQKFLGGLASDALPDVRHMYYINGITASEGTVITIKGNFTTQDGTAKFVIAESKFKWTGSIWEDYEESVVPPIVEPHETATVSLDTAANNGGDQNGIYLITNDSFPVDDTWKSKILATHDADSGVFLNGEKTEAVLFRYTDGKLYIGLADDGIQAKDKDKVVLKGKFNLGEKLIAYEEATFYFNGQVWSTTYEEPVRVKYTDIKLKNIREISRYNDKADRWDIYLSTEGKLPGEIDKICFPQIIADIDGQQYPINAWHAVEDTFFLVLSDIIVPRDKDVKVTLKAGKYDSDLIVEGIQLLEDYVIYVNRYGISTKGFVKPPKVEEENVKLTIDRGSDYGGGKSGIYLTTPDGFTVDETWAENIYAASYDENSGIFLNGERIDAPIKRYYEDKMYVALADIGVVAQDKDKLEIRGIFVQDDYAVSYAEHTFYFNGKTWNTTYFVQEEKYVDITGVSVNQVSGYSEKDGRWNVYIDVDSELPGRIDKTKFDGLTIIVNGKELESKITYHSYKGCLYFPIYELDLAADIADGAEITIKAGKAMSSDRINGIAWTKDFTFYTFMGGLTEEKPTKNTSWQNMNITGLPKTSTYREEWGIWQIVVMLDGKIATENATTYYRMPIEVNGKTYEVKVTQQTDTLYFEVTKDMVSPEAKSATLRIKKGAETVANAGKNGIRIQNNWTAYLFNQTWSEKKHTEVTHTDINFIGVQASDYIVSPEGYQYTNFYLWSDVKFPCQQWYDQFRMPIYYNGEEMIINVEKATSRTGRSIYMSVSGEPKAGDRVKIKGGTKLVAGGYSFTIEKDFEMVYRNGVWSEYIASDVKAPVDDKSLWDVARFDKEFIPYTKDGIVTTSNTDKYNVIRSMEDMKDFTISFKARKLDDKNAMQPNFTIMLRGNAIDDTTELSTTACYGYVVSFRHGQLSLFKNNENWELLDAYRISYELPEGDEKFLDFGVDYEYTISIYNVTDTCVCIVVSVNGKEEIRYYDHATDDPMDPAVNAGTFAIHAECTTSIQDDVAELDEVLASADTCETNSAIYVAASYPYVATDTVLATDGSATIVDGVFRATKPGTYTVTGTYKGKELAAKQIVVTEAEVEEEQEEIVYEEIVVVNWPAVIALGAGCILLVAGIITFFVIRRSRKAKGEK